MKLKNKQTGEIGNLKPYNDKRVSVWIDDVSEPDYIYNSLSELNEEWEDAPEEPKEIYYLTERGVVDSATDMSNFTLKMMKEIGNYFETEEEAEKVVEKLKAWKRLKDKGLTFCSWKITDDGCSVDIETTLDAEVVRAQQKYITDDLDLLFGGEE